MMVTDSPLKVANKVRLARTGMETDHTGGQSHLSRGPAVKIDQYMMATETDVMDRRRIVTMMQIP